MGIIGNIVIGIIGSFLGFWLFDVFDVSISEDIVGTLIAGVIGALVILLLIRLIRGR